MLAKGNPTMGSLAETVAMAAHSELWLIYLAILREIVEDRGEDRGGEERRGKDYLAVWS